MPEKTKEIPIKEFKSEEIKPPELKPEQVKELLSQLKALEAENQRLKKENWELRFDTLTGLERSLIYYTRINNEIVRLIQEESIKSILEKESLTEEDLEKLKQVPLSVTSLDLGYLSKYNEDPEITYRSNPFSLSFSVSL
jgi:hypothetical protein